jgi:hypothetical protein
MLSLWDLHGITPKRLEEVSMRLGKGLMCWDSGVFDGNGVGGPSQCFLWWDKPTDPSDLHSSRLGKGPGVGTSPLGGTNWVGTVVPSMAMGSPSLGKPIGRSGDPTQPVPSPLVLPYGTPRNRKWTGFSRFYGFLGVGPYLQILFPCYLMGFWAIFAHMGLLTLWDPF